MGRAYSEDLRRRIVAAVAGGLSCRRRHGSCGERELRDQAAAALASHWVGRARPEGQEALRIGRSRGVGS